jgi:hypothetical protein
VGAAEPPAAVDAGQVVLPGGARRPRPARAARRGDRPLDALGLVFVRQLRAEVAAAALDVFAPHHQHIALMPPTRTPPAAGRGGPCDSGTKREKGGTSDDMAQRKKSLVKEAKRVGKTLQPADDYRGQAKMKSGEKA